MAGRRALAVVSTLVFALLAGAAYELVENLRYQRWRQSFDNGGWFGKVTVPSQVPDLLWEYRPYGRHHSIEVNRYGFRERDSVRTRRDPETVRIAFVGDSVTLGLKVTREEAFVARFEELQRGDGAPVEALNFGVDGYDAAQVRALLASKVLEFRPDLVVYALSLNDFDSRHSSGLKAHYFRKPRWFLGLKVEEAYRKLLGADFHAFYFNKNRRRVFDEILTMERLAQGAGAELLVAVLPVFYESWAEDFPLHGVNREILAFLEEGSIPGLDVLAGLSAAPETPGEMSVDLWHPNAVGHRRIAELLWRWPGLVAAISKEGSAPPPSRRSEGSGGGGRGLAQPRDGLGSRSSPAPAQRPGAFDELEGGLHHRRQGPGIGEASAGDIEGGAVVDGGAQIRQAEGPVGGLAEGRRLDGDEALVVVEGEHPIELSTARSGEERVGAHGAVDVHAQPAGFPHRRGHVPIVLLAEETAFSGMGVDPGDGDAAPGVAVQAAQGLQDGLGPHPLEGGGQRQVGREQGHLKVPGQEGHQVVPAVGGEAASLRQVFGMTAEARQVVAGDGGLRNRSCHQGVGGAPADGGHRRVESRYGGPGISGGGAPRHQLPLPGHGVEDQQGVGVVFPFEALSVRGGGQEPDPVPGEGGRRRGHRLEGRQLRHQQGLPAASLLLCQELEKDLGADPSGISLGQRQDPTSHGGPRLSRRAGIGGALPP